MDSFLPPLPTSWHKLLAPELNKDYFLHLVQFLQSSYQTKNIFPPQEDIFNALKFTPYENVKVVILGQDPYHNFGQAHGLSFSVLPTCPLPPSLKNIFKELTTDCHLPFPTSGNLMPWAKQGVLLLNTVLTVEAHQANSHRQKGWEIFTDKIIQLLNNHPQPLVFILWGNPAQAKAKLLTNPHHLILKAPHPSPLSAHRGFFGSKPFTKANDFLIKQKIKPIDWQLP